MAEHIDPDPVKEAENMKTQKRGLLILFGIMAGIGIIEGAWYFLRVPFSVAMFAVITFVIIGALIIYQLYGALSSGIAKLGSANLAFGAVGISKKDQPAFYWAVVALDVLIFFMWLFIAILEIGKFFSTGSFFVLPMR
jgi:hypothetical protein